MLKALASRLLPIAELLDIHLAHSSPAFKDTCPSTWLGIVNNKQPWDFFFPRTCLFCSLYNFIICVREYLCHRFSGSPASIPSVQFIVDLVQYETQPWHDLSSDDTCTQKNVVKVCSWNLQYYTMSVGQRLIFNIFSVCSTHAAYLQKTIIPCNHRKKPYPFIPLSPRKYIHAVNITLGLQTRAVPNVVISNYTFITRICAKMPSPLFVHFGHTV